jgi:alpha-1,3-rhamnosyltransferase
MGKSLVTVAMPAYNHEKYVQQAIKSVIDQDYENIELIIINDCAKGNTHNEICS